MKELGMAKKKAKKKKREQAKKFQYTNSTMNEVVMDSVSVFLQYVVGVGEMLKYFLILVAFMLVFVMGSLIIYILFGEGCLALWDFILDFFRIWEPRFVLILFVVFVPFVAWWYFSKYMTKHYKADRFIMKSNKVIIEKRNGVRMEISYPVLKEYIYKRKIYIGPDWISVPYEQGRVRLYSESKNDVEILFRNLADRCDFPAPDEELQATLREYMIGWMISYLFGVPCVLFGCFISIVGWMTEEVWSISGLGYILFSADNFIAVIGVIIILVGYMLKCIYYIAACEYFASYKEWLHVSW